MGRMHIKKSIIGVMAGLLLTAIAGCNHDEKTSQAAASEVLQTEREALENAKAVEQTVMDAAAQQRQQIDQGAQ